VIKVYRVVRIETASKATFNLSRDKEISEWLKENTDFFSSVDKQGNGLTSIFVDDLERMLDEIGDRIDEDTKKRIREDMELAISDDNTVIDYLSLDLPNAPPGTRWDL